MARKKKKQKAFRYPNLISLITKFFSERYKYFIVAIFIYFAAKSLYFIFNIPLGVAPDELEHFELVKFYEGSINFFEPFRDIPLPYGRTATNNGFLYHLLMGKLLFLNIFTTDLIYIRLLNLFLATLNIGVFYKLCSIFTKSRLTKVWLMVFYTNILMFTFISSAVNYDNLVNLIGVSSIYFFIKFCISRNFKDLSYTILFVVFGVAVKTGYWPLAIVLVSMFILDFIWYRYSLKELFNSMLINIKTKNYVLYFAWFMIVLLVIFNAIYIGGRYKKYGNLDASCDQLYSREECLSKDEGYKVYEQLSDNFEEKKKDKPEVVEKTLYSLPDYTVEWYKVIIERVFGIFGHRVIEPVKLTISFINYLFLFAIFASIYNFKYFDRKNMYIFLIAAVFTILILVRVNFQSYMNYGIVHAGLQGRYLFPVLSALILWLGISISGEAKSSWAKFFIILLCIVFLSIEFPMYLNSVQRESFEVIE